MPEKANPNYSASAINLRNPPEVKQIYDALKLAQKGLEIAQLKLREAVPELWQQVDSLSQSVLKIEADLKEAIKMYGSYQDTTIGEYALISQSKSAEYHAQPFLQNYSQFVPAVIVQSVNPDALKGLIKGGLIPQVELEEKGVITYKTTDRMIIK